MNDPVDRRPPPEGDVLALPDDERADLAASAHASPEALRALGQDARRDVRRRVALNARTPPDALERLARDADDVVRLYARSRLSAQAWRSASRRAR